jgi:hypothetical protein
VGGGGLGGINGSGGGENSFSSGLGRDWDGQSYLLLLLRVLVCFVLVFGVEIFVMDSILYFN